MKRTVQITLTAYEEKLLIAYGVSRSSTFIKAYENHKILFKGSTTVSALSQIVTHTPLRICGRMTRNGMKANKNQSSAAHWLLYNRGVITNVDSCIEEVIKSFSINDLFITGANAIDCFGNAALLIGSPCGGGYGKVIGAIYTEGFKTLILATSDKLIRENINELYDKVHRQDCDYSNGMACGLAPIHGKIITEIEAIKMIADTDAYIFAHGGIDGAEGGCAIQIEGEESEISKVLNIVDKIKKENILLGDSDSLEECEFPSYGCGQHLSCRYSKKNLIHQEDE